MLVSSKEQSEDSEADSIAMVASSTTPLSRIWMLRAGEKVVWVPSALHSQPSSHSCPEGRYQTFLSFFLIIAIWFCQKNQGQPFVLIWICVKTVYPKENQPWIFTGRSDAEAPTFWPPDVKSQLFGKDPDAGTDWGQEEKRVTEDELFGWHHWLNGHKFEQTPGDSEGWGGLACCSLWGRQDLVAKQQQRQIIAQLLRAVPLPNIWQYWGGSLCNQVHDLISEARLLSLLQRNTPLKGCVYSYGLFVLLYGRNQQNIVKHLKNRKKSIAVAVNIFFSFLSCA